MKYELKYNIILIVNFLILISVLSGKRKFHFYIDKHLSIKELRGMISPCFRMYKLINRETNREKRSRDKMEGKKEKGQDRRRK